MHKTTAVPPANLKLLFLQEFAVEYPITISSANAFPTFLGRNVERMTNSDHVAARGVAMIAGYPMDCGIKKS
uniref:Uncharacterized protein n=1 Tax=Caenorhabditis japonica TaxID=281687 RepID=A0A8R1EGW6_CAEJA